VVLGRRPARQGRGEILPAPRREEGVDLPAPAQGALQARQLDEGVQGPPLPGRQAEATGSAIG
jgi:hypothetical protein